MIQCTDDDGGGWEEYPMFEDDHPSAWLPEYTDVRGCKVNTDDFQPVDYVNLFLPDGVINLIVEAFIYGEICQSSKVR